MLAAAAFGSAGYDVVCIDPSPELSENAESSADTRTTALLLPAKSVLTLAGIWRDFNMAATPLRSLKIVEANENSDIQKTADFKSSEIGRDEFGWNIANRHLRGLLKERLRGLPTVTLMQRRRAKRVLNRDLEAIAELSDGSRIAAKFVVAADGRNSAIRDRLGIGVVKRESWQTALAFSVVHEAPHGDTSVDRVLEYSGPHLSPAPWNGPKASHIH